MRFQAYHGCLEEERRDGNTFLVDVTYTYDAVEAARKDSLEEAVDYSRVYDIVSREMAQPSNLLENVAWRISEALKREIPEIQSLKVRVAKQNPPVGGPCELSAVTVQS